MIKDNRHGMNFDIRLVIKDCSKSTEPKKKQQNSQNIKTLQDEIVSKNANLLVASIKGKKNKKQIKINCDFTCNIFFKIYKASLKLVCGSILIS